MSWREPGTGKVRSKHFHDEAAAVAYDYRIKAAKLDGSATPDTAGDGTTLAEIALKFYAANASRMAAHTVESDLYTLKSQIIPAIGVVQAEKLTRADADKLVQVMRDLGNKPNTIRRKMVIVKAALNWAVEIGVLQANPLAGYKLRVGPDAIIMPPTRTEVEAILAHAPHHLKRGILLTYHLGLRPGPSELLRLTWMDADLAGGTLRVTSAAKGGSRWREIPIPDHLLTQMVEWQAQDGDYGPIIRWAGRPVNRLLDSWMEAKSKAGITRRIRLYDLRHAFATEAIGHGADIRSVSDIMGHATPTRTLNTYQHALSRNKRKAVEFVAPLGQHSVATNAPEKPIFSKSLDIKVQ